jgi:hypothetical protein
MKTYPILFSTEMVQAILDGRKTQTRRVVKPQPAETRAKDKHVIEVDAYCTGAPKSGMAYYWKDGGVWNSSERFKCKYGYVGDVLWVREEHLITFSDDRKWITVEFKDGTTVKYYYKDISLNLLNRLYKRKTIGKWQRARFLPKELARLFLKNVHTRAERLHDIDEEDSELEGVKKFFHSLFQEHRYRDYLDAESQWRSAKSSFESLWISINGEESWEANPWVWVIEFERTVKPENF